MVVGAGLYMTSRESVESPVIRSEQRDARESARYPETIMLLLSVLVANTSTPATTPRAGLTFKFS